MITKCTLKKIKKVEKQILDMYEPIVNYNEGIFRNLSGGDIERWKIFKNVFPKWEKFVGEYDELLYKHQDYTTPLPPFIVFPTYSSSTIGWRMGTGEEYMYIWDQAMDKLNDEAKRKFCGKFDYPLWWDTGLISTFPWKNKDKILVSDPWKDLLP